MTEERVGVFCTTFTFWVTSDGTPDSSCLVKSTGKNILCHCLWRQVTKNCGKLVVQKKLGILIVLSEL